jgi:hypothetical protein
MGMSLSIQRQKDKKSLAHSGDKCIAAMKFIVTFFCCFAAQAGPATAATSRYLRPVCASDFRLWTWVSAWNAESLGQIEANKHILTDVSYGNGYAVACGDAGSCTLKSNFNTSREATLKSFGVRSWPLLGCGSTPLLRKLFANPDGFITAAVAEADKEGFDGYNLDFEPYDKLSTNDDGAKYGRFLDKFSSALHAKKKMLSLDYFSNNAIWNLPAMNDSAVDLMISMDTYVKSNSTFEAYYQVAHGHLDPLRTGIGMCTGTSKSGTPYGPDPCPAEAWTSAEIQERLRWLEENAVHNKGAWGINLWVLPLPDPWWKELNAFYKRIKTGY